MMIDANFGSTAAGGLSVIAMLTSAGALLAIVKFFREEKRESEEQERKRTEALQREIHDRIELWAARTDPPPPFVRTEVFLSVLGTVTRLESKVDKILDRMSRRRTDLEGDD